MSVRRDGERQGFCNADCRYFATSGCTILVGILVGVRVHAIMLFSTMRKTVHQVPRIERREKNAQDTDSFL
jgi:hypothetical protein